MGRKKVPFEEKKIQLSIVVERKFLMNRDLNALKEKLYEVVVNSKC